MRYKPSYYNVFSDTLNEAGERMVFNSVSARSLLVSDNVYRYISENRIEALPPAVQKKLADYNLLVSEEKNEFEEVITQNIATSGKGSTLYEAIQPTAICQLGCYYCGQKHTKDKYSEDLTRKVIDRIINRLKNNPEFKALSIGWFGAEPLTALAEIKKISEALIAYCDEHGLGYSAKMTTNGVALTLPVFVQLTAMRLNRIEITLDGTKEYHDRHRYTKTGKGSFDRIMTNLKQILFSDFFDKKTMDIAIRCNVDENNFENVSSFIDYLHENKLHEKIYIFYPVPVYSWGGNDAHKKSLEKRAYAAEEINWIKKLKKLGFSVRLLPGRKKTVCLSVDKHAELIDTYGNLHNCTETSLSPAYGEGSRYNLGNIAVKPEVSTENAVLSDWYQTLRDTDQFNCKSCQFLPVCGGSCPKSWIEGIPACPPFKFNFKERLELLYQQQKQPA